MTEAEPKPINIAMIVLQRGDDYLLQRRGVAPNIGAPGLIGFFGGKIEGKEGRRETAAEAAAREAAEETTVVCDPSDLSVIGKVTVDMYHGDKPVRILADVTTIMLAENVEVSAKEGELVSMTLTEMGQRLDELTPATRQAYLELLS